MEKFKVTLTLEEINILKKSQQHFLVDSLTAPVVEVEKFRNSYSSVIEKLDKSVIRSRKYRDVYLKDLKDKAAQQGLNV